MQIEIIQKSHFGIRRGQLLHGYVQYQIQSCRISLIKFEIQIDIYTIFRSQEYYNIEILLALKYHHTNSQTFFYTRSLSVKFKKIIKNIYLLKNRVKIIMVKEPNREYVNEAAPAAQSTILLALIKSGPKYAVYSRFSFGIMTNCCVAS